MILRNCIQQLPAHHGSAFCRFRLNSLRAIVMPARPRPPRSGPKHSMSAATRLEEMDLVRLAPGGNRVRYPSRDLRSRAEWLPRCEVLAGLLRGLEPQIVRVQVARHARSDRDPDSARSGVGEVFDAMGAHAH